MKPPRSKRLTSSALLRTRRSGKSAATSATAASGPAVSCEATMMMSASPDSLPPQASASRSSDVASVVPFGVSKGNWAMPATVNSTGGSACSSSAHAALKVRRAPGSTCSCPAAFSLITISAPVAISRPRRIVHGCVAVPATP